MEENNIKKKNKNNNKINMYFMVLSLILIAASIGIGFYLFMHGVESHESSGYINGSVMVLECDARQPADAFFFSELAEEPSHKIKVTFNDGMVDKLSYSYSGIFEKDEAEIENSIFRANYNIYMGENGLDPEYLTPTFFAVNNEVRIDLYVKVADISSAIAKLFFLPFKEYNEVKNLSEDDFGDIYERAGFSCRLKY